jgi:putative ABC transport system ATP-binding protein
MKQTKYSHVAGGSRMFIEGKELVKKYGKGEATVYALDHTDFSMEKSEIVVILGPSGSGKSTLLNILGGLDKATEGSMIVDGKDLEKMSAKELEIYRREKLGFVFQSYNLTPDLTVRENVEMTAELVKDPLDVDALIENLGLTKYEKHFPKELSGGQQQRVAIARAMVKKPDILLCDELTGALDTKSSKDVLRRVQKMNDTYKTTVVIITHNLNIAQMADRIIKITDGKVTSNLKNADKKRVEEMEL